MQTAKKEPRVPGRERGAARLEETSAGVVEVMRRSEEDECEPVPIKVRDEILGASQAQNEGG